MGLNLKARVVRTLLAQRPVVPEAFVPQVDFLAQSRDFFGLPSAEVQKDEDAPSAVLQLTSARAPAKPLVLCIRPFPARLLCCLVKNATDKLFSRCRRRLTPNAAAFVRTPAGQDDDMAAHHNTLIVHVARVRDIPQKNGKAVDAYCSLSLHGSDKWRSKVTTNIKRIEDGVCDWDEHLEFQVNESFTWLQINVQHKNKLGTTETLATCRFNLAEMQTSARAKWYTLHKKGKEDQPRGQILMSYEFSNQLATSISQMSLNDIGKEKKLDKLKRHLPFRNKKAKLDAQSLASLSIMSRRSSIGSNSSAIAFSPLPSPCPSTRQQPTNPIHLQLDDVPLEEPKPEIKSPQRFLGVPTQNRNGDDNVSQLSINVDAEQFGERDDSVNLSKRNFAAKLRHKADRILHRNRNSIASQDDHLEQDVVAAAAKRQSCAQSIASSSGFGSNGCGQLDDLNENTSKEHLLNVISHLRKELLLKENRIRDLEEYTGRLLSRIMDVNPELLQVSR